MKKRVLMPLMMAGMMLASLVALDSCKKSEPQQQAKISVEEGDAIIVRDREGELVCPYCNDVISHNEVHWHYFGTPKPGFDINEMMEGDRPGGNPHFWEVDDCLDGLSDGACLYSGVFHDDPTAIQQVIDIYQDEYSQVLTPEEANTLLLPRFHAHRITYRAFIGGSTTHSWHVGGGVPGWPNP